MSWEQRAARGGRRFSSSVADWFSRFSSVTHFLLWATVVVFVAQLLGDFLRWPVVDSLFALSVPGLQRGFLWQPVTYMFLHGGLWHILINLLILWFIGREVEYFIGPKYFARLYVLGGVMGATLWLAFNLNSNVPVVGASAAVLACVVAFATLFPEREITLLVFFVIPVTIKAKVLAIVLVALDVVPLLQHSQSNVAHLAHLGGAALGYLYIKQLGYGTMPRWLLWFQFIGEKFHPRRRPAAPVRKSPRRPAREMSADEYMRDKVDPILDKIAREGMQSLTSAERAVLDSAKEYLRKRKS